MSMPVQRSAEKMDGTGQRLLEHGRQNTWIFQPNIKHTKVDGGISECNGSEIPKGAELESSVAASAKSLRILSPNETRIQDTKPLVSSVKADALKQKMTELKVKGVGKEVKSKCLGASGATQVHDKGKTTSQDIPLANCHPPAKHGKGVSVSKEFQKGCAGLDHPKSGIFIDRSSHMEPKSTIGVDKTHDKLIRDDIWGCSLTGRKLEISSFTGNMTKDHNKVTHFISDETCTVAQEKFALMELCAAKSSCKGEASGSRVSKLNSRADVSRPPKFINKWFVAHYECPEVTSRNNVIKAVELFEEQYMKLLLERKRRRNESGKAPDRIDVRAAMILKEEGKWVNTDHEVGKVPGIEIGDQFQYRVELSVIGLHSRFSAGIDYIKVGDKLFATCIVNSGRYKNERRTPDEFIYTGEGGNPKLSKKKPEDQKLKCGNLALKTSMVAKLPVRVVHCCQSLKAPNTLGVNNGSGIRYTYDGLYTVRSYWKERDESGKLAFKFKMIRVPDQPSLASQLTSEPRKSTVEGAHGKIAGLSPRKEKKLIPSLNATTKKEPPHCAYKSVSDGCSSSS